MIACSGGHGSGDIYDTPYYAGNTNDDYAAVNQPNYESDVYTW